MKKYCLFGGYVDSSDGDRHYVAALKLCTLYRVPLSHCVLAPKEKQGWRIPKGLIALSPDATGRYELPKNPQKIGDE